MVLTTAAIGQKVSNKINFPNGQKLEMVMTVSTISEGMGNMKIDMTITRLFDINNVKDGSAEIEHKVKRLQMNLESAMFGNETFDSEKEGDLKKEGFSELEKAIKNKYSMTVNSSGMVTAVKPDDNNPSNQDKAANGMMENLTAQVGDGLTVPAIGDRTEFRILPENEIRKGESWTDSTQSKDSSQVRKTVYTIADITENDIMITFTEDAITSKKQEVMGNQINIKGNEKTTGRITLDRKSGLMKEKSANSDIEAKMEVMGQTMPMNSKVTKNWVVKGL
jgi:hypothetical protein